MNGIATAAVIVGEYYHTVAIETTLIRLAVSEIGDKTFLL